MNSSTIAPAARSTAHDAEDRQRQQHELHPAREQHRLDAARAVALSGSGSAAIASEVCAPRPIASAVWRRDTSILFVGDVVGRTGRRALETLLPALREELAPTSSSSTARTPPAASASRRRRPTSCSRWASTRSRSATTPTATARSGPTSTSAATSCAPPTTCRPSRAAAPASSSATATTLGVVNLSGNLYMQAGSPALVTVDEALREVVGRRPRARRHARRGDEREGRARLVPRRQGHRRRRHAHARADRRRARAPGRDRLHHRRRHDRRPRRRDRRPPRAVDRGHAHAHADALRLLRRGPVDQRGADPGVAAAAGGLDRADPAAGAG